MSTDFNGSLMHTIHLLYLGVQKRIEHILTKQGKISFSQFLILSGFSCKEISPITQARLAEHLQITEATVSRHIQTLVKKKFLIRKQDALNKKAYNLDLTKEGEEIFFNAKNIVTTELENIFSIISNKEKQLITLHFTKIVELLHEKK